MDGKAVPAKLRKALRIGTVPIAIMVIALTLAGIYLTMATPKEGSPIVLLPALLLFAFTFAVNIWVGYKTAKEISKRLLASGIAGAAAYLVAFWLVIAATFPLFYKLLVPVFSLTGFYDELAFFLNDTNRAGVITVLVGIIGFALGSISGLTYRIKSEKK